MNTDILKRATILAVDDQPLNLAILNNFFEKVVSSILLVQNGERALELAASERPDIILLDIVMPGIDGYEVCRRLKEHEETASIPVIFISALSQTADIVRGFEAGGVDYVAKPIQKEEVLARVTLHMKLRWADQQIREALAEKERLIGELSEALSQVKTLKGFFTICSSCKRIFNEKGAWEQIESYISKHSEAEFSHGICPDCGYRLYPKYYKE